MMPHTADVVIIGGGVIGSSIAYALAARRIPVLLLEKRGICSATSCSCEGFVFLQSKKPGVHLRMALESARRFKSLEDELETDIEYVNCGGMVAIESREEFEAMRVFAEQQLNIGLDVRLLDGQSARMIEPELSERIAGATYSPQDSQVNPMLLTYAFIDKARKLGAQVCTETAVTAIGVQNGAVESVITSRGVIQTRVVINAAGPFAPEIGRMAGLAIPITPRRGQLIVTEAAPQLLKSVILSAAYIAAKFNPDCARRAGEGISVEQTASGNLVIGSTREFVGYDTAVTAQGIKAVSRRIVSLIPRLTGLNIIRTFAGLRPYTPDGLPILGAVEGVEGFIMAAGHEGDGIALSPVTGDLIAQLVDKGRTDISLDDFGLERFNA